jgi:hypothetical protein
LLGIVLVRIYQSFSCKIEVQKKTKKKDKSSSNLLKKRFPFSPHSKGIVLKLSGHLPLIPLLVALLFKVLFPFGILQDTDDFNQSMLLLLQDQRCSLTFSQAIVVVFVKLDFMKGIFQNRYQLFCRTEWYIRQNFSKYFKILGFTENVIGGLQDVVLLEEK